MLELKIHTIEHLNYLLESFVLNLTKRNCVQDNLLFNKLGESNIKQTKCLRLEVKQASQ